jgi:putative SOS response-associated peptidase YedK
VLTLLLAASNARSEPAATAARCLVPAEAFYEWKVTERGKQPYAIARDGQPMAFAGLWESFRWPDETVTRSFTVLTTAPNAEMAALHDRMPVILKEPLYVIPPRPDPPVRKKAAQASKVTQEKRSSRSTKPSEPTAPSDR